MHIEVIDDLNIIIYLNHNHIKNIDFSKKEDLQEYFKTLFMNLKDCYGIDINGFYNINVYKDKYYGVILEIEKENIEYMDYFNGQIDMNIIVDNNSVFLYEIDDFFYLDLDIIDKINIHEYKSKLYINVIDDISDIQLGKMIEFSKIIYGEKGKQIIKYGKIVNIKKYLTLL